VNFEFHMFKTRHGSWRVRIDWTPVSWVPSRKRYEYTEPHERPLFAMREAVRIVESVLAEKEGWQ
jgi:hypothetical protein